MISVTGVTNQYTLQPSLIEMHKESLEWLSTSVLWKRELSFFQKLLDDHARQFPDVDDKKEISHFQNLITYYQGELIDAYRKKLRDHENQLAKALQQKDEKDVDYFKVHGQLIESVKAFNAQFIELKNDLFSFIERAL